jgi:hypothetical protein
MAWGKSNEQWVHTAAIMATLASIHGDPDGMRPTVATFHPYMIKPEPPKATPGLLASLGFVPVKGANDGK